MYDGGVYIKEAASSALLKAYAATDPVSRKPRHFSFVGGDYRSSQLASSKKCDGHEFWGQPVAEFLCFIPSLF
ncbi:MAG: hypothetical protein PSV22_05925, partial [Pseudolabrys sp.]|nr:hypothetical protein [Pseudolabrys sp.]